MRRNTLRVFAFAALAPLAGAQIFDAASVKPAAPQSRFAMRGGPGTSDPGRITYSNVTLKALLTKAYGVERYQIAGPSWLEDVRYDIVAKVPPGSTREQLQQMFQALLAERFGLVEHRERKELPIYALVAGKNGPKLKVSGTEPEIGSMEGPELNTVSLAKDGLPVIPPGYKGHIIGMKVAGKTMLRAKGASLKDFANLLTGELDRPVFDYTGLTEKYDFGIAWSTDEAIAKALNQPSALEPGLDVFAALQAQLGLKLEPRKASVEMVVVDRVEREPTAN
ncbi:MAG: TIGR03435 family protein [Bryobacteraceae bacterium]